MRDVSESLAGRVAILELPPFSQAEFARPDLKDVLWNGGYPIPAMRPDRREVWLRSYVSTYVERDVRQLRNIPDLRLFSQFLNLAAARHSQEFHPAGLSRELGFFSAHSEIMGWRIRGILCCVFPCALVSKLWRAGG